MSEKEVNVSDYFKVFFRYKYLILIILVVFLLIGIVFYKYEIPIYEASISLEVGQQTVGQTYEVSNTQQIASIMGFIKSYHFVSTIVIDLELDKVPIKSTLIERLKTRNEFVEMNRNETVFYYLKDVDVRVRKRTRNIIDVYIRHQQPNLASKIADRMGELTIENNKLQTEILLDRSLDYLDQQLRSLSGLINTNRAEKEAIETSEEYAGVFELQEKIANDKLTLSSLTREVELLRVSLSSSGIDDPNRESNVNRLDYLEERIPQLREVIKQNVKIFNDLDRSAYYKFEELKFSLKTNEVMYQTLLTEKQKLILADLITSSSVRFLNRAFVPISPDKTKGFLIIVVFLAIGAGFSFALVQGFELINKQFKSVEEAEEKLGLKIIGNIPKLNKEDKACLIGLKKDLCSRVLESYRSLATNIKFAIRGKKIKTIIVSSDKAGTGKSMTVMGLAYILSESGKKVLVLDGDLRRPTLHKLFKKDRKPGLTDYVMDKEKLDKIKIKIKKNLDMIPAGSLSYNPQNIFESENMKKLLSKLKKSYSFIFIDSIPLTSYTDVDIMASLADASVLVMDRRRSNEDTMELANKKLKAVNSTVLGLIVNKIKQRKSGYYYQYEYDKKK